jgi:type VI secretion system protein ImpF
LSFGTIVGREGASQTTLRDHLVLDLGNLMNMIHLQAAPDLTAMDHVRKSTPNYGLQDLSRLTTDDTCIAKRTRELREALLTHEPRLIAVNLKVNPCCRSIPPPRSFSGT